MREKPEAAATTRGEEVRGLALVLGSAVAYGAMPILAKLAYADGMRPAALLAYRFLIATVLFALIAGRGQSRPWRDRIVSWALGTVFVGNAFAYFAALEAAPASTVAPILYAYPVLVTLLAAMLGLEPLTRRSLLAAGMAFGGVFLTARLEGAPASRLGILLALLTAFIYSVYVILGSRLAATVPAEAVSRHVAQVSAVFFLAWAATRHELAFPATARAWGAVVGIAVVCTVFALRAFMAGLARIGPARAAVASAVEVVATVVLAIAVLGEELRLQQWVGAASIVAAVLLQSRTFVLAKTGK